MRVARPHDSSDSSRSRHLHRWRRARPDPDHRRHRPYAALSKLVCSPRGSESARREVAVDSLDGPDARARRGVARSRRACRHHDRRHEHRQPRRPPRRGVDGRPHPDHRRHADRWAVARLRSRACRVPPRGLLPDPTAALALDRYGRRPHPVRRIRHRLCRDRRARRAAHDRAERCRGGTRVAPIACSDSPASLSRARTAAAVFDVVLVEGREALAANAGLVAMPSADGTTIEIAASLGFTTAEQDGLAARPGRPRHPDRGRPDAWRADLPGRGRAGAPLPGHDRVERPDRQRPAADGRAGPRRRSGSASSAGTGSPRRSAPSRRRSPTTARTRSSARACTTPSAARGRRSPCSPRSASTSRARSTRTPRFARWPSSWSRRSPTSASSISCTARGSSVARSSTPIPRCRTPRARSSASHRRSAATRRSRSRSARAGRSSCR